MRLTSCLFAIIALVSGMYSQASSINFFEHFIWDEVNDGTGVSWEARAGLQAVRIGKNILYPWRTFAKDDAADVW